MTWKVKFDQLKFSPYACLPCLHHFVLKWHITFLCVKMYIALQSFQVCSTAILTKYGMHLIVHQYTRSHKYARQYLPHTDIVHDSQKDSYQFKNLSEQQFAVTSIVHKFSQSANISNSANNSFVPLRRKLRHFFHCNLLVT